MSCVYDDVDREALTAWLDGPRHDWHQDFDPDEDHDDHDDD